MAGRFTDTQVVQRCFNPVKVFRNGKFDFFPCGRCSACLLDKANRWSFRLCDEIESTPYSIFFTLTYSNKYLPKLKLSIDDNGYTYYSSDNEYNKRFNTVDDVVRDDEIQVYSKPISLPISGFDNDDYISYCSKRDVQLWLKLLRQDIYERFQLDSKSDSERESYRFRYYIISEYGPTTFRSHYHGLLFVRNPEVADYLLRLSMYQNWQMCDKTLFDQYTHYCDSAASGYVTQYITSNSNLPTVLTDKQVRPFRLASKSPSIGFVSCDDSEILEKIAQGINEYTKVVDRCETRYIFPYPSQYMHRLFPKCREYSLLPYKRLHYIYGFLFHNVFNRGFSYDLCNGFIRKKWYPADVSASQKAFKICSQYGLNIDTYLYLLDMYYYKESMFALKQFYLWQESHYNEPVSIIYSYSNFGYYVKNSELQPQLRYTLSLFLAGFGINLAEIDTNDISTYISNAKSVKVFRHEVEDIVRNMVKIPKFNEKFGFAPHNY